MLLLSLISLCPLVSICICSDLCREEGKRGRSEDASELKVITKKQNKASNTRKSVKEDLCKNKGHYVCLLDVLARCAQAKSQNAYTC
jgi:hypothetical protein